METSGTLSLPFLSYPRGDHEEVRVVPRASQFSTFVDEPPSIARGGHGVVVTGCPTCRKKFGTMPQFLDHLTDDVLPAVLDRLSSESKSS
jgi:hypothetical protein